jgi:hypothetical protein
MVQVLVLVVPLASSNCLRVQSDVVTCACYVGLHSRIHFIRGQSSVEEWMDGRTPSHSFHMRLRTPVNQDLCLGPITIGVFQKLFFKFCYIYTAVHCYISSSDHIYASAHTLRWKQ